MAPFVLQGDIWSSRSLDSLCEGLAVLHRPGPSGAAALDLSGITGLSGAALALLVANLRSIQGRRLFDPLERLTAPYACIPPLTRLDLQALLSDRAGYGLHEGGDTIGFRSCEPFGTGGGVTRAVSAIQMRIAAETELEPASIASLGALIADLAENVLQHARSEGGGVASLMILPEEDMVELAIADCGIGIRGSLVENPEFEDIDDDLSAIKAAVRPGATADPGSGGGYGLFLARLVVRDNGGSIIIRSGTAEWSQGSQIDERSCNIWSPGTLAVVRARLDRPFNYDRIDDFLEDPVGLSD